MLLRCIACARSYKCLAQSRETMAEVPRLCLGRLFVLGSTGLSRQEALPESLSASANLKQFPVDSRSMSYFTQSARMTVDC